MSDVTRNTINVSLASDENYVQHLAATLASVLSNCPDHVTIRAYILSNGLTKDSRQRLDRLRTIHDYTPTYITIDPEHFRGCALTRHTVTMYYRLRLPELLPGESKVIYLDADAIVRDSLEELWETQLGHAPFAAAPDSMSIVGSDSQQGYVGKFGSQYYNSGVLLMNLEQMRCSRVEERILDWIRVNSNAPALRYPDQDAINALYSEQIMPLSIKWNYQYPLFCCPDLLDDEPAILHFTTSNKPWLYVSEPKYKEEYWKYLQMTPWRDRRPEGRTIAAVSRKLASWLLRRKDRRCEMWRFDPLASAQSE